MAKLLAFSGSAREGSYNQMLVRIAAAGAAEAGADVTVISLADFPMPLFDQDLESAQGMPEPARRFKQLLMEHDGLLIASPEYNSAFSPLLKNALDWASRTTEPGEAPLSAYTGKYAVIMAASPGALGGLRGLVFVRMLLENMGVTVLPTQKTIRAAHEAFETSGVLKRAQDQAAVMELGGALASMVQKMKG